MGRLAELKIARAKETRSTCPYCAVGCPLHRIHVESGDSKYGNTTVQFSNGDGKMHIQEIHVGGTKAKLVFDE